MSDITISNDGGPFQITVPAQGPQGIPGPGYLATSTTSLACAGSGSKTFAVQAGLAYGAGARIRATSVGSGEWMEGVVTAYSGTSLTATMDLNNGTGTHADWSINLAGQRGQGGATGGTGAPGADGSKWYSGSGAPASGTGADGDYYFRTDTSDIYKKAAGAWGSPIANIKGATGATGPTGATGATGSQGSTWYSGSGAPSAGTGVDGDFYFRTDTSDIYKKTAGAWGSPSANIKGATGTTGATGAAGSNGATWYTGSGAPSAGTGVDGDLYLRTDTSDVYKKTSGAWGVIANIKGATGATGPAGTSKVVQSAYAEGNTRTTLTPQIPNDDTVPQDSEGTQLLSLSFTPTSTSNKLLIIGVIPYLTSSSALTAGCLFISNSTNAIATALCGTGGTGSPTSITVQREVAVPSTSALTIQLRAGGLGATSYLGQDSAGTVKLGSSYYYTLLVLELAP